MKVLLLFLGIFFLPASYGQIIDVVFDLDWTLVYPLSERPQMMEEILEVEGKYYRLTDWSKEVLLQLHRKPDVRVSFFSGGESSRNLELLKKIRLNDELSALDIAYKVLSKNDLTTVNEDPSLAFTQRFKKDLTLINADLSRVVLVDDSREFVLPDQKKNQLWLGETYNFYATQDELPKLPRQYDPPDPARWGRERKKMLSVYGALDEIYQHRSEKDVLRRLPVELPTPIDPCNLHF
jgi:hypothetical protein